MPSAIRAALCSCFMYAIYNAGFPHVQVRHEQGAIHAAEGFAKVTGIPGVVIATSGPGATNLVTGLADAMLDSVPILAITGAVARNPPAPMPSRRLISPASPSRSPNIIISSWIPMTC